MLVIKREGKRKEVAAERDIYKSLIVEVKSFSTGATARVHLPPALVRPISASIR